MPDPSLGQQTDLRPQANPGLTTRLGQAVRYVVANVKPTTWFSPGQPIQPVTADDTFPRRYDYPTGYNYRITPRLEEGVSFAQLRALAENHDVTRLCIETRKDQVALMRWELRMRDPKQKPDLDRLEKAKKILQFPDRVLDWNTWIRQVVEEMLVIDALCIEPRLTRGGELGSLDLIDGSTIKPVLDAYGRTPEAPSVAYQQILKNVPAREFSVDDLLYYRRNPRVWKVYGYSPVEQVVLTINMALRRQTSVLQHFTEGNVPEGLFLTPKDWNADQVREFDSWFNSLLAGNTGEMRKVKFVPGGDGATFTQLKPVELKSEFDEWLARIVCFAFSIPPSWAVSAMNRATAQQADETGKSEGLLPILRSVENIVNQLLERWGGFDDIEFAFGVAREVDELKQAQADEIRVKTGIESIDEIRIRDGKEPIGIGHGIITPMGFLPLPTKENENMAPVTNRPQGGGPEGNPGGNPGPEADSAPTGGPPNKVTEKPAEQPAAEKPAAKVAKAEKKKIHIRNKLDVLPQAALAGLTKTIYEFFQTQAKRASKAISRAYADKVGKIAKADSGKLVDAYSFNGWDFLVAPTAKALAEASRASGAQMVSALELGDADLNMVDTRAVTWAQENGAALVGKKWVDGELVDNPSAEWAIDSATRDMLASEVAAAVEEGIPVEELAQRILDSDAFSLERARTIAQTEMQFAHMAGNKLAWDEAASAGLNLVKYSLLSADHVEVDECDDNAAQGPIPYDAEFSSGDDAPPFHPHCFCDLVVEVEVPEVGAISDEEADIEAE